MDPAAAEALELAKALRGADGNGARPLRELAGAGEVEEIAVALACDAGEDGAGEIVGMLVDGFEGGEGEAFAVTAAEGLGEGVIVGVDDGGFFRVRDLPALRDETA